MNCEVALESAHGDRQRDESGGNAATDGNKQEPSEFNEYAVLAITTLTSVATIIGSGILALPVTLFGTSIPLFVALLTASLFAQIATVFTTVEILQRCIVDQRQQRLSALSERCDERSADAVQPSPSYDTFESPPSSAQQDPSHDTSLFTLATLYLPVNSLRIIFHIACFFSFVGLLVSYGLAGPQALWQLASPPPAPADPPLWLLLAYAVVGTLAVVFFVDALLPFFSALTVVKGALFVAVVFIVGLLPASAHASSAWKLQAEQWQASTWAVPFLMTTVALGGMAITIPVTFRMLPPAPTSQQVLRYRRAVVLGLLFCYTLNIGWVLAVLQIVPRRSAVTGAPSLQNAYDQGQISTVPLVQVLSLHSEVSPRLLHSVQLIVELFILISTCVSFFVIAAGCKNYMDGLANAVHSELRQRRPAAPVGRAVIRGVAYFMSFGVIIAMIMDNPQGFIAVLTRMTSMSMNLQSGVLLFVMLYVARMRARKRMRDSVSGGASAEDAPERRGAPSEEEKKVDGEGWDIALPLDDRLVSVLIVLGSIFFSFSWLLASFGPFFGVELSGSLE